LAAASMRARSSAQPADISGVAFDDMNIHLSEFINSPPFWTRLAFVGKLQARLRNLLEE
jgi:hypothetical protein